MLDFSNKVICGDSLEVMRQIPDNSVDACVTDPPYGLSKEPNITEVLTHWLNGDVYEHKSKGFMGKSWDSFVPGPEYWRELFRILKPGAHALIFCGTRTYDLLVIALRIAGFEIRDQLDWVFAQGFPKSLNVAKAIEAEDADSAQFEGFGTGLKPAHEPICLVRKPISEQNIALNIIKWGVGALNIERSRIKCKDVSSSIRNGVPEISENGRYPANFVLSHHSECEVECHPECPVKELDKQSGTLKSGTNCVRRKEGSFLEHGSLGKAGDVQRTYGDQGGASRFFYCAKASPSERNAGCEGVESKTIGHNRFDKCGRCGGYILQNQNRPSACHCDEPLRVYNAVKGNFHPTVKPIKLCKYLVSLITPPNGLIIDPFSGSGSVLIGAKQSEVNFIGIELNDEYCEISKRRLAVNYEDFADDSYILKEDEEFIQQTMFDLED